VSDPAEVRKGELEFIERHRDADFIYDTKTRRVVEAIYPVWHPFGRLQRFLVQLPPSEEEE
jgi:hypothetical protein